MSQKHEPVSLLHRARRRVARLIDPEGQERAKKKRMKQDEAARKQKQVAASPAQAASLITEAKPKSSKDYDAKKKNDYKREMLDQAMKAMKSWRLHGDYLEFGVYRGRSFIHAYKAAEKREFDMHFYAFDSFQGLPELIDEERSYQHFEQGQYACTEEEFRSILLAESVDLDRVTMVPGFYDQSLTEALRDRLPVRQAAIVWIDCDLYESTVPVLDFVTPYLRTGSFLIFDDWFSFGMDPLAGEYRATREWLERNPHLRLVQYRTFGTSGAAFIVQNWPEGLKKTDRSVTRLSD